MLSLGLVMTLRNERKAAQQLSGEAERAAEKLSKSEAEVAERAAEIVELKMEAVELRTKISSSEERERDDKMREKLMGEQFKNLANEILSDQSQHFKSTNKESIDTLLKPFQEKITTFGRRVEEIHTIENKHLGSLENQLRSLMELNSNLTSEAQNLTSALKGNSKVQGDWGEMILESILDSSSLIKGTHYTTQYSFKDEEGNNQRPDVVLNLPEGKRIIIDSKCSLTAFVSYVNEEEPAKRQSYLAAHLVSVSKHIKELANKDYQKMLGSPDFVIMFIPNEPAFLAALQADNQLWSNAYKSRVIISSPTNLFALLKMVDDLWRRNVQERSTKKIADEGKKLYEQLVAFTDQLVGVGTALKAAQSKYDDAYHRFTNGNNNLMKVGKRLADLGISTSKKMNEKVLIDSELDDDEDQIAISEKSESGE